MCRILLSTPLGLVAFISAYIHYQRGLGIEALSAMISTMKEETPFVLIVAASNGHSPCGALLNALGMWWGRWWKTASCSSTLLWKYLAFLSSFVFETT